MKKHNILFLILPLLLMFTSCKDEPPFTPPDETVSAQTTPTVEISSSQTTPSVETAPKDIADEEAIKTYKYGSNMFSGFSAVCDENDNWGFVNADGEEVIPLTYECAFSFSEGLAAVEKDGRWGYIDFNGNVVIPFQYEGAYYFSHDLAPVKKNGKWGYINRDNKLVIDYRYDKVTDFNRIGYAVAFKLNENGEADCFYLIDTTGNVIMESPYGIVTSNGGDIITVNKTDDTTSFVDLNGNEIFSLDYAMYHIFCEEVLVIPDKAEHKISVIDRTGKVMFEKEVINSSLYYHEGLLLIQYKDVYGVKITAFIDKNGDEVMRLPDNLRALDSGFCEGLLAVKTSDGRCGYIDKTGKVVIEPIYDRGFSFYEGHAVVQNNDKSYSLIDINGEKVFNFESEAAEYYYAEQE